jgi:hypothetical protein
VYFIKGGSDVRVKGYVTDAAGTAFPLGIIDEDDVRSVKLDGFTVGSNTAINSDNSIFTAFRNTQAQLNSLSTAVAGGIKIPLPIDCSANPNYPPAAAGDSYLVTVGGRIGGASGPLVQAGDKIIAQQTNAGGNQATVGSAWYIIQGNIDLATTTTSGITRIATDTETNAGSENFAYVTPSTLRGGVRNTTLTGYAVGSNAALSATDTLLGAFGKVQGQLNAKVGGSGAAGQVAFWSGAATQIGDSKLTFNSSTGLLTLDGDLTLTGAQTIQTSTGNLTLATGGGNGNIILSPNGTGNVGIGTSSPSAKLEISSGTLGVTSGDLVVNTENREVLVGRISGTANDNSYLVLRDRVNRRVRLESTGAGGIITVEGDNNLSFGTNNLVRWSILSTGVLQSNGAQGIRTLTGNLTLATAGGNGNIILSPNGTGNVGIGTSTPSGGAIGGKVLHITSTAETASVRVDRIDAAAAGSVSLSSGNLSNSIFSVGDKPFTFLTNSAERMRITSTGNVGIGTTTPSRLLHVAGAIRITGTAAPSTPLVEGDMYFDSGTKRMRFRDGTSSWIDMGMFWESAAW